MPMNAINHTPNSQHITPTVKIVLGLDFGVKKMGMALGNTLTNDTRPFDILAMDNGQPDWDNLLGIIETWAVDVVVVGLPLNMDGSKSMLSMRAHKFARRLHHRLGERKHQDTYKKTPTVYMVDERLSSREAYALASERGLITDERAPIDDVAACLLIVSYFEGNGVLAVPAE